ncbi:general transcription factor 3C polypeptide 5 [Manduca sexta]|uniref:general transcription factor 3C polypeptide 5 n=1 Tax=Manduca sexta TaxID=7130 RepID=UPI00188E173A|nr:general transcription factor 3C polypeptide 5 [Manduca sexta]
MDYNNLDRNLVAVLFPGVVKNDQRAIECLGGIRNISQVYTQQNKKRLGMCYQPENPFIKKIYADNNKTAGVLLKIRVKKSKVDNEVKREVISTTVLGRVKKIYRFDSMCDFQYLPILKEGTSSSPPKCILEEILPSGVDSFNFITDPSPLFVVPWNFTRFDRPITYAYTDRKYFAEKGDTSPQRDDDVHNKRRSERGERQTRFQFNLIDDLPTEPNEYYIKQKNEKIITSPELKQEYEIVKKLFEERPIWSLNLLKFNTKIKFVSLKMIIPCLAFHLKTGPWRAMWVRYGYDPRKDPGARIYQILDFRMRHQGGARSMVTTKDHIIHYKKADRVRNTKNRNRDELLVSEDVAEGAVYFKSGMVPTQRQVLYQFCDVQLPEVQELLAEEPPPGYLCHEKHGWLSPNVSKTCRDHMFRNVKQTLFSNHNTDLKIEEASSDDESNSDEDLLSSVLNEADETL